MKNRYVKGQHNLIDDLTGFKIKSGDARKLEGDQKGLITHYKNWNPEQPQLRIRSKTDKQTVTNVRERQTDNFITTPVSRDDL
jgi:hypothetical protein